MANYTSKHEFVSTHTLLNNTFATGKTKSIEWRKWQLKQCWWMLQENEDAIIEALQKDLHKHAFEAFSMDLLGTRREILDMLKNIDKWSAGEVPEGAGFLLRTLTNAWVRREPYGVALIVGTFNFPLYTLMAPAVAAVAAGNCVLLKPSEVTPNFAGLIADLVPKYLDVSAIGIVTGGPDETSFMLEHKFNHIFFTGGARIGRIIAAAAAKHLTPVVLELGGQNPAIVTRNANIDLAAKRIAHAKLINSGQFCLCVNHVFVDPTIHDEFASRVKYWMEQFLSKGTDTLSHIINEHHFNRIKSLLDRTDGKILYSGDTKPSANFLHPTVVVDVTVSDSLLSEELFGPLLPILKADIVTAISTIKSMPHPLGLYIFSNSQMEVDQIIASTTSGGVTINDVALHSAIPGAPFGGVGESGYGSYHGRWGFDSFSHKRPVMTCATWMERLLDWRYHPYDMKNCKKLDISKVSFKKGETMEDQRVGKSGAVDLLAKATAVIATLAVVDSMTGGRLLSIHTFGDVLARLRK